MSRRRGKAVEEEKADIDLTPMLDVVFIMLIFFIVTASFVKEKALDVNVPDPDKQTEIPPDPDKQNILLTVNANDEIFMAQSRIDTRAVRARIAQLYAENPQAIVIVRAHNKSSADTYVQIADAAQEVSPGIQVSLVPFEE
ncbi:biopolymer transporter ExbD [Microbulbifer flavimaris]|uniref:Biopolymer transporter ExbD n=1 Tax=Microbulbifer flavimaris TaxID=1781068 RepID=A0ABX4HXI5_9GAMM|nr:MULTISPECIES: biopolymer transporter ExbD [Microbulbifer]KUJ82631.1 biopolymer transporter ExbD [Microbulbifer sp. ZGT114]PCO04842.1 biopolymer transporter ExbD [Microbulbifer flavimaris]